MNVKTPQQQSNKRKGKQLPAALEELSLSCGSGQLQKLHTLITARQPHKGDLFFPFFICSLSPSSGAKIGCCYNTGQNEEGNASGKHINGNMHSSQSIKATVSSHSSERNKAVATN